MFARFKKSLDEMLVLWYLQNLQEVFENKEFILSWLSATKCLGQDKFEEERESKIEIDRTFHSVGPTQLSQTMQWLLRSWDVMFKWWMV